MITQERRPFARALRSALALFALSLVSFGPAGCSHRSYRDAPPAVDESATDRLLGVRPWDGLPDGPAAMGGRPLFPLAVGNRWDYDVHSSSVLVTGDGPQPPLITDALLRDEITGLEQLGPRTYFVEQESNPAVVDPQRLVAMLIPLRQDRSGLFERDLIATARAAAAGPGSDAGAAATAAFHDYVSRVVTRPGDRAAFERAYQQLATQLTAARWSVAGLMRPGSGGPDPGEISLLRYPLFVGARWAVRESPRFARVVIGRERALVPAGAFMAWHLRGESELYGPHDRVAFWYSNAGLVRISLHFEATATDDTGNPVGHIEGEEDQVLTALNLVDPNAPHAYATAPVAGAGPR